MGAKFARETMRSDDPERKIKGKLLLISLILFVGGAFLDVLVSYSVIFLFIARILLIASAIGFYGAYILPKWMKKLFLRQ